MATSLSLEQEQQALAIAEQAWSLPLGERKAFINKACQQQPALLFYLEELLGDVIEENFLDPNTLFQPNSSAHQAPSKPLEKPTEWDGKTLGPYRIIEGIARGGMGDVYLAERGDGAFDKQVAIKFIRRDLGFDVEQRFANERNILARLQHPNIAQLLDGGTSVDGHSYYVMEYIEGVRLDHYCQAHQLNSQQILELLIKVGHALSAAHAQLIIHRDLKPDNILVTQEGEPKLLDFGIAKIYLDSANVGQVNATTINPLTPRYASPEQLRQENLGPATDVYSLGVILYELLTGTSPYGEVSSSPFVFSQKVLDSNPTRPSRLIAQQTSRPSRFVWTKALTTPMSVYRYRDLDPILLKALAKSPAQRYTTVQQFINDLQAYLKGQPVSARQPSWWYYGARFVSRHKLGTLAAGIIAALSSYAFISNYQHLKEIEAQYLVLNTQQQRIAEQGQQVNLQQQELQLQEAILEQEQLRIQEISQEIQTKNQLIVQQRERQINTEEQLGSLDNENETLKQQVEDLAESADQRIERIFLSSQQYLSLLNKQYWPEKQGALSLLQQQQRDIDRVFGDDYERRSILLLQLATLYQSLGFYQSAYQISVNLTDVLASADNQNAELTGRVAFLQASIQEDLGLSDQSIKLYQQLLSTPGISQDLSQQGQIALARLLIAKNELDSAEQLLSIIQSTDPARDVSEEQAIPFYTVLGSLYQAQQLPIPALAAYQKALAQADKKVDTSSSASAKLIESVKLLKSLAAFHRENQNYDQAAKMLERAKNNVQNKLAWPNVWLATIVVEDLKTLLHQNQILNLETTLVSAINVLRDDLGLAHPSTWEAQYVLSELQFKLGLYHAAAETIENLFLHTQPGSVNGQRLLGTRGSINFSLEKYEQAQKDYEQILLISNQRNNVEITIALSNSLVWQGHFDRANHLLQDLETDNESIDYPDAKVALLAARGLYWELQGDNKNALDFYAQAVEYGDSQPQFDDLQQADLALDFGRSQLYRDRFRPALRNFQRALAVYQQLYPSDHPKIVKTLHHISAIEVLLENNWRLRDAKNAYRHALELRKQPAETIEDLIGCYVDMVKVVSPQHSYLFDYWFLQGDLFQAMTVKADAYDNHQNSAQWVYNNSNKPNRQAISCFEALLENHEFSNPDLAVLRSQLGMLYLSVNDNENAKSVFIPAQDHFVSTFGPTHPRARFLQGILESSFKKAL